MKPQGYRKDNYEQMWSACARTEDGSFIPGYVMDKDRRVCHYVQFNPASMKFEPGFSENYVVCHNPNLVTNNSQCEPLGYEKGDMNQKKPLFGVVGQTREGEMIGTERDGFFMYSYDGVAYKMPIKEALGKYIQCWGYKSIIEKYEMLEYNYEAPKPMMVMKDIKSGVKHTGFIKQNYAMFFIKTCMDLPYNKAKVDTVTFKKAIPGSLYQKYIEMEGDLLSKEKPKEKTIVYDGFCVFAEEPLDKEVFVDEEGARYAQRLEYDQREAELEKEREKEIKVYKN